MDNKIQLVLNQKESNEAVNKNFVAIVSKLKKIKLLEEKAITLDEKIESIKKLVGKHTNSSSKKFQTAKEQYILLLIKKYELKSLTKWQKEIIMTLINEEVDLLHDMGVLSDKMKAILQDLKKLELENMSNSEKEMASKIMKSMMNDMGFDTDEEFSAENIFENDFFENMNQKFHEENAKREEENNYKNKKDINKNTDINFQKIYKSLIKLCHPDLSKTKEEKAHNEELTKKLTVAWQSRDYYELLVLWLEIDPNNSINLEINKDNQKSIIKNLNTKILQLEHIDYEKKFRNPLTAFYYKFNSPSKKGIETNIKKYNNTLLENIKNTENYSEMFKKTTKFKEYLAEIYDSYDKGFDFDFFDDDDDDEYDDYL